MGRSHFFLSPARYAIFPLMAIAILTCSIGRPARSASAFEWEDSKEYIGATWQHYTREGYLLTNLYADSDLQNFRSIQVGHHFDHFLIDDWTVRLSLDNTENEGFKPGFMFQKRFFSNYLATFNLQPFTRDKSLSLGGYFWRRKIYGWVSYNLDRETSNFSLNWRAHPAVSLYGRASQDMDGDITTVGGLRFHFVTGDPSARRTKKKEKPIEWLDP